MYYYLHFKKYLTFSECVVRKASFKNLFEEGRVYNKFSAYVLTEKRKVLYSPN